MYTVILEPAAQRDMRRLTEAVHSRILAALHRLEADPRHRGVKRLVGFEHQWRARVGEYRVLYEVDDDNLLVEVYRVAHRSEAYR
ncbi:MAG: type II toxin-antitoxin system RelE/ParE family toxin [Chloroflexota bacterium]